MSAKLSKLSKKELKLRGKKRFERLREIYVVKIATQTRWPEAQFFSHNPKF